MVQSGQPSIYDMKANRTEISCNGTHRIKQAEILITTYRRRYSLRKLMSFVSQVDVRHVDIVIVKKEKENLYLVLVDNK